MISSKINIKCPDCKKEITISIKTIETLQNKIKLQDERIKHLENKLLSVDIVNSNKLNRAFGDIFK